MAAHMHCDLARQTVQIARTSKALIFHLSWQQALNDEANAAKSRYCVEPFLVVMATEAIWMPANSF